jgi:hypothetical protein
MRCVICRQAILDAIEPIVPTTMGDLVHMACADREARAAYCWRTGHALASAGLAIVLLSFAARSGACCEMLALLLMVVAVGHLFLNRGWRRLTVRWARWRWH